MRTRLVLLALAAALALALVPTHHADAAYGTWHCVQPGENLFRIAMAHGTTVYAITQANGLANPNYVQAGQCLFIPAYPAPAPCPPPPPPPPAPYPPAPYPPYPTSPCGAGYHLVMPGETLFSIGRMYGVSPWSIAYANHLPNPNYIRAGQCLVIPH
jgi:LysM repeat protein